MQRIGNQLTQAADKQPFKIKEINIIYGETEAFNRKGNLGSEQKMENWDCSLYLCDNQTSPAPCFLLRCLAHFLSRAALLLPSALHSGSHRLCLSRAGSHQSSRGGTCRLLPEPVTFYRWASQMAEQMLPEIRKQLSLHLAESFRSC